ncbi:MAG: methylenetetrahydrofolate--tRNA-(uracil(54)-C(5))-methyltransferase (FADH(2)-oxidizing) TrmFO [Smithellaceae bacterium]|nr:methylenetetrahydrofolate--tRNA-(uracil(54)-C(5))-methyltransferase (FADH(2)-oxidizing) TrmFO [Smithellaceae bacterium]
MSHTEEPVSIIGGGLAGCEAAWQLLRRGHCVDLYEMKPLKFSPAHRDAHLAELVCSNSFRSNDPNSAAGLLKEEMRLLSSLLLEAADKCSVPAGTALAVDRNRFSLFIEAKLTSSPRFNLIRSEMKEIPDNGIVIIASGPLTSDSLADHIASFTGSDSLYFYDAISPIIDAASIDISKVFPGSRYGRGGDDYLNCPFTEEEYLRFWNELSRGETVPPKPFEESRCFEGCLPIEVMAGRGPETLTHGPMKPVGLLNPVTGKRPFAAVQLRRENLAATHFNIVGFQTKLTWSEQRRIFRLIPGLEKAEFTRYGSIHRNTFVHSPSSLQGNLQCRLSPSLFFAGQITGVEGYIESTATGLIAGINVSAFTRRKSIPVLPEVTAHGALLRHLTRPTRNFQPTNINHGLLPPLVAKTPKWRRGAAYRDRSLRELSRWIEEIGPIIGL